MLLSGVVVRQAKLPSKWYTITMHINTKTTPQSDPESIAETSDAEHISDLHNAASDLFESVQLSAPTDQSFTSPDDDEED